MNGSTRKIGKRLSICARSGCAARFVSDAKVRTGLEQRLDCKRVLVRRVDSVVVEHAAAHANLLVAADGGDAHDAHVRRLCLVLGRRCALLEFDSRLRHRSKQVIGKHANASIRLRDRPCHTREAQRARVPVYEELDWIDKLELALAKDAIPFRVVNCSLYLGKTQQIATELYVKMYSPKMSTFM